MKLHKNQQKLLLLLQKHIAEPLSMEELAEEMDISSKSVVHHHIKQLEKKGYLIRNTTNPHYYQIKNPEEKVVYLPMYGMAKCGPEGTILDGTPTRIVPVDPGMVQFPIKKGFMVEAKGSSMEDLIHAKDWLIVEQSNTPKVNDIVVCVNNEETMVKRFCTEGDSIILISDNRKFIPIIADKGSFKVEGIVRSVIKRGIGEA
ncbi:Transcriptional repressor, LexA family [Elusimicrobium minutum Pei191]|uniref:Transcriptional repressor, LexA family n=1 Tax=Elusimicrobium minutum (strain Pei191) TaxID=445932 RepID=B2KDH7_ELUMP|nr:S24 family peptidase [Elusimicrobium minutum]ACC98573.1 Transcriptional repressor, LexA family [Elusimicrobium minutum Pei191]